MQLEK